MAVRAQAKYIRITPRKAREVVDLIRGKSVAEARSTLFFANRNAARVVAAVLNSAVANAEHNNALSADDLYRQGSSRRRGSDPQAVAVPGHGPREPHPQAQQPHHDRGRAEGGPFLVGQKVHPGGFRVGVIHDWKSHWYTEKEFKEFLAEDERVRAHILRKLSHAGLSRIMIRKDQNNVTIDIQTARPGIVIGKSGSEVDALRKEIHGLTGKNIQVNIIEVKRPELDAVLVAQSIAEQLENRVSFRRAMKRALTSAMRSGAAGMRVRCGGRLGGAEMARTEHYSEGRVPLHTLRADIDYGFKEARTTFGRIGVKVWINKGEILPEGYPMDEAKARQERDEQRRDDRGGERRRPSP